MTPHEIPRWAHYALIVAVAGLFFTFMRFVMPRILNTALRVLLPQQLKTGRRILEIIITLTMSFIVVIVLFWLFLIVLYIVHG